MGAEVKHEMSGVCRMRVSIMGVMVASHGLQCQGCLDFVHLHCHIHLHRHISVAAAKASSWLVALV